MEPISPENSNDGERPVKMAKLEIRKGADSRLCVGGLLIEACRREVDVIDGGITLYLFEAAGEAEKGRELVRMDLFRNRPHYHAPAENQAEVVIDANEDQIVAWGIEAVTQRAPALAKEAGFPEVAGTLDCDLLGNAASDLKALLGGLSEPTEISYFDIPEATLLAIKG